MLVAFLFTSYKTGLIGAGSLEGKLHVEMDQDPTTGLYTFPVGQIPFQATLSKLSKTKNWCMGKAEKDSAHSFSGNVFRDGPKGSIRVNSGLVLDYFRETATTSK